MLRFSDSKNTEKLQGLFLCSFFLWIKITTFSVLWKK